MTALCFNPRAHVGRDVVQLPQLPKRNSFNPRAHVGRDGYFGAGPHDREVSIHAPTWGATMTAAAFPTIKISFNPRAHVGRDTILQAFFQQVLVSIHAPTWGATALVERHAAKTFVSIHAPTWGAT